MKRYYCFIILALVLLCRTIHTYAANRVTSVNAYQSGNLIIVDYELTKGADIELQLYIDGVYSYLTKNLSGDVGKNITPGKKRIVWDVLKDYDVFNYDNVQFKVYSYGKTHVPWKNFIMVNGGFTTLPDYSFGITYARVKKNGFYLSAMSNFNFRFNADYYAIKNTSVNGVYPMYTGQKEYTKITASVGYIGRLGAPIYLYLGAGYGYRGLFYETSEQEWVAIKGDHCIYHGGMAEVGLMTNIKGFALSLGFSIICDMKNLSNYYPEAKVGIGYCF